MAKATTQAQAQAQDEPLEETQAQGGPMIEVITSRSHYRAGIYFAKGIPVKLARDDLNEEKIALIENDDELTIKPVRD